MVMKERNYVGEENMRLETEDRDGRRERGRGEKAGSKVRQEG